MADSAAIEATIQRYWQTWSDRDRDGWLGLFADDATIEDPVGAPLRHGKQAMGQFFDESQERADRITFEGCAVQVCGNEAAFHMLIRAAMGDTTVLLDAIDVMTFHDDARIASMRAFLDPSKARVEG